MTAPQTDINLNDIQTVLDLVKTLAEKGALISEELEKFLGPIGNVAAAIKRLIDMVSPKPDDPVMIALGELKNQITDLSNKVENGFEDMKAFELGKSFAEKYNVPLNAMLMKMTDTFGDKKKEAVEHFEETFKTIKPQDLVYDMAARLLDDTLNPLKKAMEADPLMTTATFQKWTRYIDNVVAMALFIEKFATGLFPESGDYETEKIIEKNKEIKGHIEQWDNEYRTTPNWWEKKIPQWVHKIQDDTSLDGDEKKLTALWEGLQAIHTNNLFYAVCFSSSLTNLNIIGKEKQVFLSFDRAGYNILVYHCPQHSKETAEAFKTVFDTNFAFKDPGTIGQADEGTADSWFNNQSQFGYWNEQFGANGLFLGVRSGNVATRWPKDLDGWTFGPGYFTYDLKCGIRTGRSFGVHYFPMYFLVAE